jgi:GTPase SAR1 family protein
MGGCQSNSGQTSIDDVNKKDMQQEERIMKILLLGAGDSGKTTIFKQMKILHQKGYQEADRQAFRGIIHTNVLQGMKDLIAALPKLNEEVPPYLSEQAEFLKSYEVSRGLNPDIATAVKTLWSDQIIRRAFEQRAKFQMQDEVSGFFDSLDRLSDPRYLPTDSDILRARSRTTGIVETMFVVDGVSFRMYDVGGQRNERRKWIHCFDNVHAVMFVAAISEYDQMLFEDDRQNRMEEALSLFSEITNSRFFASTSVILFLNKRDLFEDKIKRVPLNVCFKSYDGPQFDYQRAIDFITRQFLERSNEAGGSKHKQIYVHITTATDTSNVAFVFNAVKDVILQINLRGSGFI